MNLVMQYMPGAPPAEVHAWELEDDPVEMTNLTQDDTGVPGIVGVSTRQGRHGPRIKWYPGRGGGGRPFLTVTLEEPPRMIDHGVAPRVAAGAVVAAAWVELNRQSLLNFWTEGTSLNRSEFNAFIDALNKRP